jgi:hypothetical protein
VIVTGVPPPGGTDAGTIDATVGGGGAPSVKVIPEPIVMPAPSMKLDMVLSYTVFFK